MRPPHTRPRRTHAPRRVVVAAALAALATPALPRPAAAQPDLEYGAISVTAKHYLFGTLVDQDADLAPPGSPALASVLAHPVGIGRFPTSTSALPDGYVSALMTGTGFGGVGVSAFFGGTPDHAAVAEWTQDITNVGSAPGVARAHFDIPRLEASLLAGPAYGPFPPFRGPLAGAGARLTATRYDAGGTQISRTTIFDYYLSIERRFRGDFCEDINDFVVSDDLQARVPTGRRLIEVGDVCGIEYLPFSGDVSLPTLAPGERLVVSYVLTAEDLASQSLTPELGYQALVGDPFQVGGAGGIRFSVATVPEPSSLALVAVGLCALGAAARRPTRS